MAATSAAAQPTWRWWFRSCATESAPDRHRLPHGAHVSIKQREALVAAIGGAVEIDVVANIGALAATI
jgi:deoxyribose-phosphate aldolase